MAAVVQSNSLGIKTQLSAFFHHHIFFCSWCIKYESDCRRRRRQRRICLAQIRHCHLHATWLLFSISVSLLHKFHMQLLSPNSDFTCLEFTLPFDIAICRQLDFCFHFAHKILVELYVIFIRNKIFFSWNFQIEFMLEVMHSLLLPLKFRSKLNTWDSVKQFHHHLSIEMSVYTYVKIRSLKSKCG